MDSTNRPIITDIRAVKKCLAKVGGEVVDYSRTAWPYREKTVTYIATNLQETDENLEKFKQVTKGLGYTYGFFRKGKRGWEFQAEHHKGVTGEIFPI